MRRAVLATILSLAAISPITATAGWAQTPSDPSWQPGYTIYYYSDAAHTDHVGTSYGYCTFYGPSGTAVDGQATEYYERVVTVWCDENGLDHPI